MHFFFKIANNSLQKHSIKSKSNAVTSNQALEEVMWLLRLEKPKKCQQISKNLKKKLPVAYQNFKILGL